MKNMFFKTFIKKHRKCFQHLCQMWLWSAQAFQGSAFSYQDLRSKSVSISQCCCTRRALHMKLWHFNIQSVTYNAAYVQNGFYSKSNYQIKSINTSNSATALITGQQFRTFVSS